MVRYFRMKGRPALWIPGTDHAGIATQVCTSRRMFDWILFVFKKIFVEYCGFLLLTFCIYVSVGRGKDAGCWRRQKDRSDTRGVHQKSLGVEREVSPFLFLQFLIVFLCNLKLWALKQSFLLITLIVYCISFALIRMSSASLDF